MHKTPHAIERHGVHRHNHTHNHRNYYCHAQELALNSPHGNSFFSGADNALSRIQASLREQKRYEHLFAATF